MAIIINKFLGLLIFINRFFLQWSLDENVNVDEDIRQQKLATVPFLLNLASLSTTLLKAITTDISQIRK